MDDIECLKAEVCRLLDTCRFWEAIKTIQNAMMENNYTGYTMDPEEEARISGLTEEK